MQNMEIIKSNKLIRITGLLTLLYALIISVPGYIYPEDNTIHQNMYSGNTEAKENTGIVTKTLDKKDKLSSDTIILTIDSTPVYWPEFYFWINFIKKYYMKSNKFDKITDWSVQQNGMALSDFFLSTAVGYAVKDRAIESKAEEQGIKLSEKDLAEIEKKREENIKIYGRTEYLRIITRMYVSEKVFNYLTRIDYLSNYLFKHLYGEKGEKCTNEDIAAYVKEKGYIGAKYIFLSANEPNGDALSAEKIAEKKKLAGDILARLNSSIDPLPLFDMLMNEHSDDMKSANGRLFVSAKLGKEFESACLGLEENKYSGIVKADSGYYIILRLPISPEMTPDTVGANLRYLTSYDYLFRKQVEGWAAAKTVKFEDAYYKIDIKKFPDK